MSQTGSKETAEHIKSEIKELEWELLQRKADKEYDEKKIDQLEDEVEMHSNQAEEAKRQGKKDIAQKAEHKKKEKLKTVSKLKSNLEETEKRIEELKRDIELMEQELEVYDF